MKLIIAGNKRQFNDWCIKNNRKDCVFACSGNLNGYQFESYEKVGTWWENIHINQIEDFIKARGLKRTE